MPLIIFLETVGEPKLTFHSDGEIILYLLSVIVSKVNIYYPILEYTKYIFL